jgi:hypothetical protein
VASIGGGIWDAAPAIVRAALPAAWASSKIGAVCLVVFFMITNLAFAIHEVAGGRMKILESSGIIFGGVILLVASLPFSLCITVPVSALLAACAYPFLNTLRGTDPRVFGIVGFLIGACVWLALFWNYPTGNLYFGSWISFFVVGGPAGCAGGLAFARHLSSGT